MVVDGFPVNHVSHSHLPFSSKMKGKGNKEDEKKKDEDESKSQQETVVDEAWSLPYDAAFHNLLKEAVESISPLQDEVKMYTALAM